MLGGSGRHGKARRPIPQALLVLGFALFANAAPAIASTTPSETSSVRVASTPSVADDLPRHELETIALVHPAQVLLDVPARLKAAQAAGDWKEQALLQLA